MSKKTKRKKQAQELDSTYLFKLVLYVIIGSQWVRLTRGDSQLPIPVGLLVGVAFASHDHFQIDRKIEYAVLMLAMLVGFWSQVGIFVNV
jgi:hypothetical protein